MKALITAGGRGTRLRPITYTLNKHLIPIANKPMIFYALEKIAACGIKEVGININEGDRELREAVGDGSRWGLKITYLEQKGGPLGLAHILKNASGFLGEEDFLFYLGDNIILGEISAFVDEFKKSGANCLLALSKVKDPQRFGVPVFDARGVLVGVEEKPAQPKSDFAVTGIYVYDKSILEAAHKIKPSARGEFEISDAHQYLLDTGRKVNYREITGWWKDTGKPTDLLEGNALILSDLKNDILGEVKTGAVIQGKVSIGAGSTVAADVVIRGPVIIGDNCQISSSYIGPYASIGNEVKIKNSEIENTIVFDGADINCNSRIVDSILGKNCQIGSVNSRFPRGQKLIIGDNAVVEL